MLETDGLFRMAATNYQQADSHLEGAQQELNKLLQKLETCLELMRNASSGEPVHREPQDRNDGAVLDLDKVEMVGS
ncbi:MAG: hypothetical protein A2Z29_05990 [Chloroflexi bacterium RBG_16_56_11]|nr:MAG: hypothetical protein A2Z29_05990 [Chloroflexi bacterium RBG_16_56_11]